MKIVFCFLTYDNIVRYDIWNTFFKNIYYNKYIVYIHPKNIRNISYYNNIYNFNFKIIKNRVFTKEKYDINIVRATLKLLEESYYDDINISHFIFLSQSCIPLYNFNKLFDLITIFPNSVISCIDGNKKERYLQLSTFIKKYIYINNFFKQQPNMILIRNDVEQLIKFDYTNHYQNMTCPDEHYFINILLHILKKKIIKKQIHFCNYDFKRTQALEFMNIDINFINIIRNYGFLFMRKVSTKSIIDVNYLLDV